MEGEAQKGAKLGGLPIFVIVGAMKKLLFTILLLLILGATGQPPLFGQDSKGDILARVNAVRAGYGLPAYRWNDQLAGAAQAHANWMAATELYRHTETNGSTPYSRSVAQGYSGWVSENIVGGTNLSTGQAVTWWVNSPVHFNGLISSRYVEAGVGFAVSVNGQNMFVLVMGLPGASIGSAANRNNSPSDAGIAPVTPIILSQPREDGSIVHTVQTGHTAWAIAARYEVQLGELLYLNGLRENSFLTPGEELIIRLAEGQAPPPTPTPSYEYAVQEGETLWSISVRNEIDFFELLYLNQLDEESLLRPGQMITLRLRPGEAPPPTPTPQMQHIVREGDTLLGIALRYGLTMDELAALNGISTSKLLQIGEKLWIRPPASPTPPLPQEMPATFTPNPNLALALSTSASPTQTSTRMPAASSTPLPAIVPEPTTAADPVPANAGINGEQLFLGGVGMMLLLGVLFLYLGRDGS